jgi:hypothetical protein
VFDYPYEFSDAFMTIKASGRLVFSKEFSRRWNDLRYWAINTFKDTSFVPAYLQMDRKRLTQCGDLIPASKSASVDKDAGSKQYTADDRVRRAHKDVCGFFDEESCTFDLGSSC